MSIEDRLTRLWYAPRPGLPALLLAPLALPYALAMRARRALYRGGGLASTHPGVPVIVVGNVTVGGTGKTPLVRALVEALAARGHCPGIVSRGYGGRDGAAPRPVGPGDDPAAVGDETPILARSGAPVWMARDRVAAARALRAAHPEVDVIVADDGLQHYALARDVEIAVVDAGRALGNGLPLPAGPLRESAARLAAVDAIVEVGGRATLPAAAAARPRFAMTYAPLPWRRVDGTLAAAPVDAWRGARVTALAGIGHPQRFFDLVRALGIDASTRAFPDHHRFVPGDLARIDADLVLMTEKDAVKCASFADARAWYLPIRAALDPALVDLIEARLHGSQAA